MKLVADIHLHSHYSRATSRNLTLEHLWKWAQIKGVQVVATGDIAHPGWLAELRDKLEPAEPGLYRLKPEHTTAMADQVPAACRGTVRFLIGGEISNIYKKYDRTRKVHNIVFAPSFDATARLQEELEKIGNIRSDGRPILGLDSRDLLEIVLQVDDRCHLIPAHIWTPWFSILGSKSGFDSVQECYADLTAHIFAVETGLSSDPPMNWRVSWLDHYTLISNSDAHSPQKLAREATCFDTELSYDALFDALRSGDPRHYRGTIEFFPEEGKYHLDGHRKCGVCWEPAATRANGGRCSACGKPVTVGVYHRMEELADRPHGTLPPAAGPFASLIPLPEALAEMLGVGPNSKRVQREYHRLVERLGPELAILQEVPLEEIDAAGGAVLAEGIRRMRAGEVRAQGGYDGEYGVIRLFDGEADRSSVVQLGMFDEPPDPGAAAAVPPARRGAKRRTGFREEAVPEPDGGAAAAVQPEAPELPRASEPSAAPKLSPTAGPPASRELPSAPKAPAPPAPESSAPELPASRAFSPAPELSATPEALAAPKPPAAPGPLAAQGRHSRVGVAPTPAPRAPDPLAALEPRSALEPFAAPESPTARDPLAMPEPPSTPESPAAQGPPAGHERHSGAGGAPTTAPPASELPAARDPGATPKPASAPEPSHADGETGAAKVTAPEGRSPETEPVRDAHQPDRPRERARTTRPPATSGPPPAPAATAAGQPSGSEQPHWLTGLNPAQRAAATHTTGPLAIVAGPGTGKTRTLTVRIAHLVRALHAPPASILVLTFTHKAADELRDRLAELLPGDMAKGISAGTFHELGARLLEEFAAAAGVPRPFAIFDETDRQAVLKQCFPALSAGQLRTALAAISASKNGAPPAPKEVPRAAEAAAAAADPLLRPATPPDTTILPEAATRDETAASPDPRAQFLPAPSPAANTLPGQAEVPELATLRSRYDSALAAAGAVDLDDLVARTVELLERDAGVRHTLQQRYRWLSVDEYQDVNAAQYRLLRLLAGGGANLCVIGDPDQAVYGFRGADHRYFLAFGDDFPGAETLRLDRNYRSAQAILTAAGQVIAHNPDHQAARLIAHHAAQVKLDVYRAPSDRAEAEYVVHQVERMIGGTSYFSLDSGRVEDDGLTENRSFADFAVLYRLNAQARLLEEAFDRSGIPYQTAGATPLAEQRPVREILALLWLTEVPHSRLHWRRVLPDGSGPASEDELARFLDQVAAGGEGDGPLTQRRRPPTLMNTGAAAGAGAEPLSPSLAPSAPASAGAAATDDAVTNSDTTAGVAAPVYAAHGSPGGRPARTLSLVRKLAAARHAAVADRMWAAAEGWAALRGRGYDEAELERIVRLQRRADAAHTGMRAFLTAAALQSETDRYDERADRVALMSLHAAKGLEFPVVFIVGCEEDLLPYRPPHRAADPAEERRLFYVGMTRARHRLVLTHATRRLLFGQRLENPISGFVTDIETALREAAAAPRRPRQPAAEDLQLPLF